MNEVQKIWKNAVWIISAVARIVAFCMLAAPLQFGSASAHETVANVPVAEAKVAVGDETSDAMMTSSISPKTDVSCKPEPIAGKSTGLHFDMSFGLGKSIGSAAEPTP
jgi:hypothetical protein